MIPALRVMEVGGLVKAKHTQKLKDETMIFI